MNLRMSDFLFEDDNQQTDQPNLTKNQGSDNKETQTGRAKPRSVLNQDSLSGPEVKYTDLKNIIIPNLLKEYLQISTPHQEYLSKIKDLISKDKSKLTPNDKKDLKKIEEIKKSDLGILNSKTLTTLFMKNLAVGLVGTIGKIHINPVQLKSGSDQLEGAAANDLQQFAKKNIVLTMLSNENSQMVTCNGKIVIVGLPLEGKDCSNYLDIVSQLYPKTTPKNPVPVNITKLGFFLLPKDQLSSLQTNTAAIVAKSLQKEMQKESFVYESGLNLLLLEDAGETESMSSDPAWYDIGGQIRAGRQQKAELARQAEDKKDSDFIEQIKSYNDTLKAGNTDLKNSLTNNELKNILKDRLDTFISNVDDYSTSSNSVLKRNLKGYKKEVRQKLKTNLKQAIKDKLEEIFDNATENNYQKLVLRLMQNESDDFASQFSIDRLLHLLLSESPANKNVFVAGFDDIDLTDRYKDKIKDSFIEKFKQKFKSSAVEKATDKVYSLIEEEINSDKFDFVRPLESLKKAVDGSNGSLSQTNFPKTSKAVHGGKFKSSVKSSGTLNNFKDFITRAEVNNDFASFGCKMEGDSGNLITDIFINGILKRVADNDEYSLKVFENLFNFDDTSKNTMDLFNKNKSFIYKNCIEVLSEYDGGWITDFFDKVKSRIYADFFKKINAIDPEEDKALLKFFKKLMPFLTTSMKDDHLVEFAVRLIASGTEFTRENILEGYKDRNLANLLFEDKNYDLDLDIDAPGAIEKARRYIKKLSNSIGDTFQQISVKKIVEFFASEERYMPGGFAYKKIDDIAEDTKGSKIKKRIKDKEKKSAISLITKFLKAEEKDYRDKFDINLKKYVISQVLSKLGSDATESYKETLEEKLNEDISEVLDKFTVGNITETSRLIKNKKVNDLYSNIYELIIQRDEYKEDLLGGMTAGKVEEIIDSNIFARDDLNDRHLSARNKLRRGQFNETCKMMVECYYTQLYIKRVFDELKEIDLKFNSVGELEESFSVEDYIKSSDSKNSGFEKNKEKLQKFIEDVLCPEGDKESKKLASMYQEKFGKDNWEKFVIYAYFKKKKRTSKLIRESTFTKRYLLSEALFTENYDLLGIMLDDSSFSDDLLFEFTKKDILSRFGGWSGKGFNKLKTFFVGEESSEAVKEYFAKMLAGEDVEEPIGWMGSIGETDVDGELSPEERKMFKQKKIKEACGLIIESAYRSLVKKEYKKEKSEKKRETEDISKKTLETGAFLGTTALVLSGGWATIPYLIGAGLFSDEISKVGTKLVSGLMGKDDTQDKLNALDYGVDLKKEKEALYNAYKDIIEEYQQKDFTSVEESLRESDDDSDSERGVEKESKTSKKLLLIDEDEVLEILEGNGLKLFSSEFDNNRIYASFMRKFSGLLRQNDNIKIKNISIKNARQLLAQDQVETIVNADAKKGDPASAIFDLFGRQMQQSNEKPIAALGKALNDVNHSGGGVANLLAYMMLTNPQGFASLANSLKGSEGKQPNVLDLLVNFMGGDSTAQQAEEGAAPDRIKIPQILITKLKEFNNKLRDADYFKDKLAPKDSINKEIDDTFEAQTKHESDRYTPNEGFVYNIVLDIFLKGKPFDKNAKDISYAHAFGYCLYNAIRYIIKGYRFDSTGLKDFAQGQSPDDEGNITFFKGNTPFKFINGINEEKTYYLAANVYDLHIQDSILKVDFEYDPDEEDATDTSATDESFIMGDLSKILFENVKEEKKQSISKKSKELDLQKEWLRIWDI